MHSSTLSHTLVKASGIPVPARSSPSSFASLFAKLQITDKSANRVLSSSTRSRLPITIKSANKTSPFLPERTPRSLPAKVTSATAAAVTAKIAQRRQRVVADLAAAKSLKPPRVTPIPGPSILKFSSNAARVVPFPPHVRPSSPEHPRQRACTRKYDGIFPTSKTVAEEAAHPPSRILYFRIDNWFGFADCSIIPYQLNRGSKPYEFCHHHDKEWFYPPTHPWRIAKSKKPSKKRRHDPRDWATTPAEADVDPDCPTKVRFAKTLITSVIEYGK